MGSPVISADSHVVEPHDLWQKHIDPAFKDRAPRLVHEEDTDRLLFEEAELPPVGLLAGCARGDDDVRLEGRWDEDVFAGGYDPQIRMDDLAKDGVNGEVLFPTIAMQLYRVKDFEFRTALFRAYNTWLAEFVEGGNGIFKGAGMLTEEDPDSAARELRRCKDLGLDAVMLPQVPGDDVSYSDQKFDVIWEAALEAGFPVNFHAATTRDEKRAWNAGTPTDGVLSSFEIQRVILDMILFGTFDKFPDLRIVSVENEAGWASQMIERADFVWRRSLKLRRKTAMICREAPSEYLHRNVRITFMRDRAAVLTREIIGDGTMMWGNDFPHHVSTWPHSQEVLADIFRDEPAEARDRIVYANAAELYSFELPGLIGDRGVSVIKHAAGRPVVIRQATVIDGTGAPARQGDVSFADGVITGVGSPAEVAGAEEVSGAGLVVAPGFIDLHTHFDAQIFWDSDFTPSCWHGVTTVVQGNTGFGIAPTRPSDRENIMQTLENVEGMNLDTLRLGIPWVFETFPEYVEAVVDRPKRLNVGTFIGHTPLRMYVMGFDAATSRQATAAEIEQMAELLAEGLRSGAIGFSTSQAPSHLGARGRPVPSRVASRDEIEQLLRVVAASPNPLVEITYGPQYELAEIARLSKELGVRITWGSLLTRLFGPPGVAMRMLDDASSVGGDVWPQVSCREIVSQTSMENPYYFGQVPAFGEFFSLPREKRAAKYADLEWRERVKAEIPSYRPDFARLASIQETSIHQDIIERPIADVAEERGVHPFDLMVDLALAENLGTRYRIVSLNDNEEELGSLLRDPRIVLGAHDAGAHADMLCDACFPTHLLGTWVRDRKVIALEEAVWRLSGQPADLLGLADRGRLVQGNAADVVLFDPATVAPQRVERVNDLPGGGERLISRSEGIEGVWVNGERVYGGVLDDAAHPGVLVRR